MRCPTSTGLCSGSRVRSVVREEGEPVEVRQPDGRAGGPGRGSGDQFVRDDIPIARERLTQWFGDVEHETKEPAGPKEFGDESDHDVFVIAEHWKPDGWQEFSDLPTTC